MVCDDLVAVIVQLADLRIGHVVGDAMANAVTMHFRKLGRYVLPGVNNKVANAAILRSDSDFSVHSVLLLTHLEDDSHQGRETDEHDGMPFFGLFYHIGQYPQSHSQYQTLPVEGTQKVAALP